ncbi:MAG: hypothetical protein IJ874_06340 [Ruminococcus sp.]|nr:hypothetical protein [Ruminococcus sp.]
MADNMHRTGRNNMLRQRAGQPPVVRIPEFRDSADMTGKKPEKHDIPPASPPVRPPVHRSSPAMGFLNEILGGGVDRDTLLIAALLLMLIRDGGDMRLILALAYILL